MREVIYEGKDLPVAIYWDNTTEPQLMPGQYTINLFADGNEIGEVTSGTMSPMLKIGIGMGYIKTGMNKVDTEIFIKIRNKLLKAKVVRLPFYKA